MAQGMEEHGIIVRSTEDLAKAIQYVNRHSTPHLIEVMVSESLSGVKRKGLPWLLKSLPKLSFLVTHTLKQQTAP